MSEICKLCNKPTPDGPEFLQKVRGIRKEDQLQTRIRKWWAFVDVICQCPETKYAKFLEPMQKIVYRNGGRK